MGRLPRAMGRNILAADWRSLNKSSASAGEKRENRWPTAAKRAPAWGPWCGLPVAEPTYWAARTRVTVSSASAVRVGCCSRTYCTKEGGVGAAIHAACLAVKLMAGGIAGAELIAALLHPLDRERRQLAILPGEILALGVLSLGAGQHLPAVVAVGAVGVHHHPVARRIHQILPLAVSVQPLQLGQRAALARRGLGEGVAQVTAVGELAGVGAGGQGGGDGLGQERARRRRSG